MKYSSQTIQDCSWDECLKGMQEFAPTSSDTQTLIVMLRQEVHNTAYIDPTSSLDSTSHPDYIVSVIGKNITI